MLSNVFCQLTMPLAGATGFCMHNSNYYGYALFFYHTLNNWAGQRVHLPNRTMAFSPHHSAFNSSGVAVLPILLGGELGTLTLTSQTATFYMSFLSKPLSFVEVSICQHTFSTAEAHVLTPKQQYTLALPSPCSSSTARSEVVKTGACTLSPPVAGSWSAQSPNAPNRTNVTLASCQQLTLDHRKLLYCRTSQSVFYLPQRTFSSHMCDYY